MTEPLIDRDKITDAIHAAHVAVDDPHGYCLTATDEVLAYLRSVLTPEALDEQTGWVETPGYQGHYYFPNGKDLHRRVFGEDK